MRFESGSSQFTTDGSHGMYIIPIPTQDDTSYKAVWSVRYVSGSVSGDSLATHYEASRDVDKFRVLFPNLPPAGITFAIDWAVLS